MSNDHVGFTLYFKQIMNAQLVSSGQSLRQTAKERHMSNGHAIFPTNYDCPIGMFRSISASKNPHVMTKERNMLNGHVGFMLYFQQITNTQLVSPGQLLR